MFRCKQLKADLIVKTDSTPCCAPPCSECQFSSKKSAMRNPQHIPSPERQVSEVSLLMQVQLESAKPRIARVGLTSTKPVLMWSSRRGSIDESHPDITAWSSHCHVSCLPRFAPGPKLLQPEPPHAPRAPKGASPGKSGRSSPPSSQRSPATFD